MSGTFSFAQYLVLLVGCFICVTVTICAGRPLQDDELSTVLLHLLETSQKAPGASHHLRPPQLSPARRTENMFGLFSKPPPPVQIVSMVEMQKYKVKDLIAATVESHTESSDHISRGHFDQNADQLYHRQYSFNSVLHKNPAGPNPIGNEYRPGNNIHNVQKYRSPPQG